MKELKKNKVGRPPINDALKTKVLSFTLSPELIARLLKEKNRSAVVTLALTKYYIDCL